MKTAVCEICFNLLHWITPKAGPPIFWCACCRRQVDPEKAILR